MPLHYCSVLFSGQLWLYSNSNMRTKVKQQIKINASDAVLKRNNNKRHGYQFKSCLTWLINSTLTVYFFIVLAFMYIIIFRHSLRLLLCFLFQFLCTVVAILLHYFFMSAFAWMFVEALHIYRMQTEARNINYGAMRFYYAIGWGVPAIITGTVACTCKMEKKKFDHLSSG